MAPGIHYRGSRSCRMDFGYVKSGHKQLYIFIEKFKLQLLFILERSSEKNFNINLPDLAFFTYSFSLLFIYL